jgi:hypothetical protein
MSSADLLQAQSPSLYGAWTNTELINEPIFLDELCPQLDEPFDFSLEPNGHERQRVDSVTESLSSTTSTATKPECESVYSPAEFSYGYQDLLISGQPFPDPDTRQVKSEPLAIATYSWDTDYTPEEVSQRLECSACSKTFSNLKALDKHTQSTSHKAWRCREPGCGKSYARRDCDIAPNIATTATRASIVLEKEKKKCSSGRIISMSTREVATRRAMMVQGRYKCSIVPGHRD